MSGKCLVPVFAAALFLAIMLGLSGCPIPNPPSPPSPVYPIHNVSSKSIAAVSAANNQFAFDLYSRYKSDEGNVFFSPFSISSALAMTYEGAKGKTADEMRAVFHFPNDTAQMRDGYVGIYSELNNPNKPYQLSTANSLWAQKNYSFNADYFRTVDEYYSGKVTNLDFSGDTENSRKTINSWVEGRTYGRIKDIIQPGLLTPATRLVLANAIYFKANWSDQFENDSTDDQDFTLETGSKVKAKMMHNTEYFSYFENDALQMLEMPYLGNDVSMFVILPKGDMGSLEEQMSPAALSSWENSMTDEKVSVSIPKFKFGTKYMMENDLKEMGMPTAFNYPAADFTGMSPTRELYIGIVIHQTFLEVSESGTEAAAATVVEMMAGAAPGPHAPPKEFTADHPFIFLIQDKNSGAILFMGKVRNPNEG